METRAYSCSSTLGRATVRPDKGDLGEYGGGSGVEEKCVSLSVGAVEDVSKSWGTVRCVGG